MVRVAMACFGVSVLCTAGLADRGLIRYDGPITQVSPDVVAGCEFVDGKVIQTTPWIPLGGAADHCQTGMAYDCFEPAADGSPTGGIACGLSAEGSRWYFGPNYSNPFWANDMVVAPGTEGAQSMELSWAWYQNVAAQIRIAIFTAEDFDLACGTPPYGNVYSGVLYSFTASLPAGGWYVAPVSLCDSGLFHQMPVDGSGGHLMQFLIDDPTNPGEYILLAGTQPFLWGTGDGESPPDGRVGSQGEIQYDDDGGCSPACQHDGTHDPLVECYSYLAGLCPDPLGGMIYFRAGGAGCEPCDTNCDGSINGFDIQPFVDILSGSGTPCSGCAADTNGDGSINGFDIQGFVECLGG